MGNVARHHLLAITLLVPLCVLGLAVAPAQALTAAQCAALAALSVPSTTITSATVVPAGGGLPEHCLVVGHVDTEINFQLRLPTTTWNGKFYHAGGGGFVGTIPQAPVALSRGYATIGTDTGHTGSAIDGSWALHRPDRQVNWGFRAIHVVTVAGKQIAQAAYGQAARLSYFEGCSNGGRQAAMEAQRFPTDFNGIIAGAPAIDITGLMLGFNSNSQAFAAAPLPAAKLTVIANAVTAMCDAGDTVVDGLVGYTRRCNFDPGVLTCPAGDAPGCLTSAQVGAVRTVYDGPINSAGVQLHPGFPPGHEDGGDGWQLWISGNPAPLGAPLHFIFQDQFMRFFIFSNPAYNSLTFDLDTDAALVTATSPTFDATNPDISGFKAAGGKLLMWHGQADPALTYERTVQYYNDLAKAMGNKNKIEGFYRLFLPEGMHHCGGGPGLNSFDALTALENWVEGGIAPDSLLASHAGPGVARTRPVCSYPKIAVYDGRGDINSAASYSCQERGLGYALNGRESGQ